MSQSILPYYWKHNQNEHISYRAKFRHDQTVLRKYTVHSSFNYTNKHKKNLVISPSLRTVARPTEIELIDNDRTRVVYTQLPALPLRSANEKVDSLTLDLVSSNNGRHSANLSAINFSSRSIKISHSTLFILPS